MNVFELDTKKLDDMAGKLRALAHPLRIAIVELLQQNKEMSVTQIYEILQIEQATASHHLSLLKNNGLLSFRKVGKKCFYYLKHETIIQIIECMSKCQNKEQ